MSGTAGAGVLNERLPTECATPQRTPDAGLLADASKSLAIEDVESQVITPVLPLKVFPAKSALELTRARIPGPLFWEMLTPRSKTSELPSTRTPALRGSPRRPVIGDLSCGKTRELARAIKLAMRVNIHPWPRW